MVRRIAELFPADFRFCGLPLISSRSFAGGSRLKRAERQHSPLEQPKRMLLMSSGKIEQKLEKVNQVTRRFEVQIEVFFQKESFFIAGESAIRAHRGT